MALVRWDPLRDIDSLQGEMNRLFSTFFDTPTARGGNGSAAARRWIPAMDLIEAGEHFVLKADLPGMSEQDVNIELEDNVLTVSGERRDEHEHKGQGWHRVERTFGRFSRSLSLPEGVDADAVTASFDRGVLSIRVPKPEERKPRRVEIQATGEQPQPATLEGTAGEPSTGPATSTVDESERA